MAISWISSIKTVLVIRIALAALGVPLGASASAPPSGALLAPIREDIVIDISSYESTDKFFIVGSEVNGVNTVLFFPDKRFRVTRIVDRQIELWSDSHGKEEFILGLISSKPDSSKFIVNLFLSSSAEGAAGPVGTVIDNDKKLRNLMYSLDSSSMSSKEIGSEEYLQLFDGLRMKQSSSEMTINLNEDEAPGLLDKTISLAGLNAFLLVPHRGHEANRVVMGRTTIFHSDAPGKHVPILIGYEIGTHSFLDIFIVSGDSSKGQIKKYEVVGDNFELVSTTDSVPFYHIFTQFIQSHNITTTNTSSSTSTISSSSVVVPDIKLDLSNINTKYVNVKVHELMALKTVQYTPVNCNIVMVFNESQLIWTAEEGTKCLEVEVNLLSNAPKSVEIKSKNRSGSISSEVIPFPSSSPSASTDTSRTRPSTLGLRVETTPPNSPARTPPPSPMARSPSNSFSSDEPIHHLLSNVSTTDGDDEYEIVEEVHPGDDEQDYSEEEEDEEEVEEEEYDIIEDYLDHNLYSDNSTKGEDYFTITDTDRYLAEHPDTLASTHLWDENTVDISTDKGRSTMHVIDATVLVPFIFLYPSENQQVRQVVDGTTVVWVSNDDEQFVKYIALYLQQGHPTAMTLFLRDQHAVRPHYYVKEDGLWHEVNLKDYRRNTTYEFTKPTTTTTSSSSREKENDRVLHVSLLVPVILGTAFIVVAVSALLFILFFC